MENCLETVVENVGREGFKGGVEDIRDSVGPGGRGFSCGNKADE